MDVTFVSHRSFATSHYYVKENASIRIWPHVFEIPSGATIKQVPMADNVSYSRITKRATRLLVWLFELVCGFSFASEGLAPEGSTYKASLNARKFNAG